MNVLRDAAAQLGIVLDEVQLAHFQRYYELLVDWNRRVNLTRITDPREVQIQHFLDSLTCLLVFPHPLPGPAPRLIDVGTGAGFPGLPLKIAKPELRVTLVDSVGKKVAFVEEVVKVLRLKGVQAIHARAEDLGHDARHRERYDIAVSRAVANLAALAEYCLPFVRRGGRLIAPKTERARREIRAALPAITTLGGELVELRTVELPGLEMPRLMVVIDKIMPTPAEFPRKAGLPTRKPLGGA